MFNCCFGGCETPFDRFDNEPDPFIPTNFRQRIVTEPRKRLYVDLDGGVCWVCIDDALLNSFE